MGKEYTRITRQRYRVFGLGAIILAKIAPNDFIIICCNDDKSIVKSLFYKIFIAKEKSCEKANLKTSNKTSKMSTK